MSKPSGGRKSRSKRADACTETSVIPAKALCLHLSVSNSIQLEQLEGCPVLPSHSHGQDHQQTQQAQQQQQHKQEQQDQQHQLQQEQEQKQEQRQQDAVNQQQLALRLESWSQLTAVLSWFSSTVLQADSGAKLSFPPCLPKDLRADVHNYVSKKLSKVCQSVSEGLGEDRYVAVVAKGSVRPACRRMTGEQQDHAMALWLLWKDHSKAHQQQQQQQQQPPLPQQVQQQQQNDNADNFTLDAALNGLALSAETASNGSQAQQHADSHSQRQYSRDEVAQMLVQGRLTEELAGLWEGPRGVEQRSIRLLCLAAAGGDLQEVQELIAAHPQLVPAAVGDLSAGDALPLHLAAAGGCVDVVQVLLAAGAPLEAKDGKGQTALQVAQCSEQCDVEAVLMQAGAVNKQKDSWGTLDMPGGFL